MSSIDKHLGSNEKTILIFRPSRKAFIDEYILFIILIFVAIGFFMTEILAILAYITLATAIIIVFKTEYKIWSSAYALTDARVMISEGIFTEKSMSCVYSNITNLGLRQSFFDKVMNTGTISIDTAGSDRMELLLKKISGPFDVKKRISDMQSIAAQQLRQSNQPPTINTMHNNPNQPQHHTIHNNQNHPQQHIMYNNQNQSQHHTIHNNQNQPQQHIMHNNPNLQQHQIHRR
ncbi:MAG: PH domain-containing protein [Candidatus Woesearchaeota archaeon]